MKKIVSVIIIIVVILVVLSFIPFFGKNCDFDGGFCVRLNFWDYIDGKPTIL